VGSTGDQTGPMTWVDGIPTKGALAIERILLANDASARTTRCGTLPSPAQNSHAEAQVLHVHEFGFDGRAGPGDPEDKAEAHKFADGQ
jgi:hypothetical protein